MPEGVQVARTPVPCAHAGVFFAAVCTPVYNCIVTDKSTERPLPRVSSRHERRVPSLSLSLSLSLSQHVTKTKPNFEGGFVYDKYWVYLLFSPKRAPAARRGLIADCPPSVERHITEREYSSKLTPHQRPREVRASAGLVMFSVV